VTKDMAGRETGGEDLEPLTAALGLACREVSLDGRGALLLRRHSNAVFRLASGSVVARMAPAGTTTQRAGNAVRVTRWLTGLGFGCVEPLPGIERPVPAGGYVVTFWKHLPQGGDRPPVAELGRLLRDLHAVGPAPFPLPETRPLGRLQQALDQTAGAAGEVLAPVHREFLHRRSGELVDAYARLDFPLPTGLIHGDAHKGNLLWDAGRVVLCDWDSVSLGPREWDLVPTHHGARFGLTAAERAAFSAAYGHDLTRWSGFEVLRGLRDLFTLGAYIRNAATNPAARRELEHRLTSLLDGDRDRRWYPL
jgi:hypothetical protein